MKSMTVTMSDDNFGRIVRALDRAASREEGEADGAFAKRWLKGTLIGLVFRDEGHVARSVVSADDDLVEVT